ncbi:phage shock envelope stress response protein PspM [Actinoplanes sp. CA-030573]|uniref:phage shock envelope stress response protein PspM n=1 Tax=Actinoplanes sp. CA-030573 TaxID=3239898 RepID=UPI003D8B7F1F
MDERTRYFRRLRRLRNSARRWSVLGGGLVAATAVLTPYSGIGIADAIWAGAAGSSVALAWWRWSDHRALAALPPPPAPDPALSGQRLAAAIERFPAGRTVMNEVRRQKSRYALRGSAVAQAWDRLDRASATLTGLAGRLTGPGEASLLEAATAERWLRDLGQRVASVERAIPLSPAGGLEESHAALADQFTEGVTAYEQLVAAAASYVAEDGHPLVESKHPALSSLVDATDRLRGLAEGLAELKRPPAASI